MTKYYLNFYCEEHGMLSGSSVAASIKVEHMSKQYNDKAQIIARCDRCGSICGVELYEVD